MLQADRLGRYEILGHLASGGMAQVYLARLCGAHGFARHVVLKTVLPEQIGDPSFVSMFLDEARLIGMLHHQHVAQVYEFDVADDGTYFLAMEYLHGETVRDILDRAQLLGYRLPLDFGLTVVAAAAAGLHHAHEQRGPSGRPLGIVHRDVTPTNLIAGYDGAVKLIDFGIAKASARSTVTQTGVVKGKPSYMSPEQARGRPVDRRSDVFTLGVVLYELTTQTPAFGAPDDLASTARIVRGDLVRPARRVPGYLPELEALVLTALQPDPDHRFQDADTMRRSLEAVGRHHRISLGETAVSRVLAELFGSRPEPWLRTPLLGRGSGSHAAAKDLGEEVDSTTLQFVALTAEPAEPTPDATPTTPPPKVTVLPDRPLPRLLPLPSPTPRRSRTLAAAAAITTTAFAGMLLALLTRRAPLDLSWPSPRPSPSPSPSPRPSPSPSPPPSPSRSAPATIIARVTTDPSNATVVLDGVRLGRSPLEITVPAASGEAVLKVRKRGYKTRRQPISLERDGTWHLRLWRR